MTREGRVGIVLVLAAVVAGVVWWGLTADDRRVDAACDVWVGERSSLSNAVDESVEAAERAEEAEAPTVAPDFFNEGEPPSAGLRRWGDIGPDVSGTLHSREDWGDDERGAVFAFEFLDQQVADFARSLEKDSPAAVLAGAELLEDDMQIADEVCLFAARD